MSSTLTDAELPRAANLPTHSGAPVVHHAPAQIAKATLQRLAQARLEPTPENYARAWVESGGSVPGPHWAGLIGQLLRGLERGSRRWTAARRKAGVERVLAGSRSDPQRLSERLTQLIASWDTDGGDAAIETAVAELPAADGGAACRAGALLAGTLRDALPPEDQRTLRETFDAHARRLDGGAADAALVGEIEQACGEAERAFAQRTRLQDELARLVRELAEGLTELAEDESWVSGQAQALRARLGDEAGAPSVRGVRAAGDLLAQTRQRQQVLKAERDRARDALKALVAGLMSELNGLAGTTGRFGDDMAVFTEQLDKSGASQDELAGLVHDIVAKSRAVQADVSGAGERIAVGRAEADRLNARVRELEGELKRLSDDVSTDALTQVANRRGLAQAFAAESARAERGGTPLAIGLIDIDNFKKLNDSLGHGAGDEALRKLAAQVRTALRPSDHVARYGGEEFVVLLPDSAPDDASQALTRMQRQLSMGLFMHEGREVFVTFSAGVTAWRVGEPLEAALERADGALYEAKRQGKNRTCSG